MDFRTAADEIGLATVGAAVAAYLARQLFKRFKPSPTVPLIETPKHKNLIADRDDAFVRAKQQAASFINDRSPR